MSRFRAGLRLSSVVFASSLLLLTACHENDDIADSIPPEIRITFPPPNSSTDAGSIVVRGTASDDHGVLRVVVNGVEAETGDGYATWSVELDLDSGENVLTAAAIDTSFNVNSAATTAAIDRETVSSVGTGPTFDSLTSLVRDPANDRVLVLDEGLGALLAVSLQTGNRTVISNMARGTGVNFDLPIAVALDAANNRALVLDNVLAALLAVDLDTGDRTVVSDAVTGAGPTFDDPQSFVLDSANNRALLLDATLQALLAVDLETGNRSVISDNVTPAGPPDFGFSISIALDAANNRVLVGDFDGLFAVDLDTGERSVIADVATGTGPFNIPASIALDSANNRALVLDFDFVESALLDVDLATGNRTVIADSSTGTGPCFCSLISLVLDKANNQVLAADFFGLFAIDLVNGQRVIWSQ